VPRRAKIVLVAVVLAAGLLLAWQFRKSPADKSTANSTAEAPARTEMALDLSAATAQQTGSPADAKNEVNPRFGTGRPRLPVPPDAAPTNAVPSVAATSDKPSEATPDHTAVGAAARPAESAVPELPPSFSGVDRSNRTTPFDFRPGSLSDPASAPTHKVVDGDSLPSLAERYLGSANRAAEIFACNRDVLSDPELLPIGARLRIPTGPARPGLATMSAPAASPTAVAPSTTTAPQSQIAADAIKTPPLLDIGSPGLSPLPPIGAQTSPPGRIYIVQPGDTLLGIAQKVYGDGGRADALLQANHDQLRLEQDLRPGMMLEAP
jgi:nucleoid-associated protein YgaU